MLVKNHELTVAVNVLLLLQSCVLVASTVHQRAIGAFVWIVDGSSYVATCTKVVPWVSPRRDAPCTWTSADRLISILAATGDGPVREDVQADKASFRFDRADQAPGHTRRKARMATIVMIT